MLSSASHTSRGWAIELGCTPPFRVGGRVGAPRGACDDGSVTAAAPSYTSFEDYLVSEQSSDVKHEWCDGVVYAMSRATPEHGRLTARMARAIGNALPKDCEVYSSDAMLYIEAARLSTYADVSIVCGALETKNVRKDGRSLGEAITNPVFVVEVLSEGTERYDRDGKFQAYKRLPSLREYVLVAQDVRRVEVYRCGDDERWSCSTGGPGERVTIHGATVSVDEVYG
jgi:Uma2 family endonuclease